MQVDVLGKPCFDPKAIVERSRTWQALFVLCRWRWRSDRLIQ
jgi:hypothetical protein